MEEPTAPEDILGTAAIRRAVRPVRVATGEHVANPVMFKQLLQAGAIDIMQIDACRVAGVNENIANLLLAAKFGVPVCPHAGGVGLCEIVQHLSMFDYVALSGTTQGRRIEWIDHLHEHFAAPADGDRRPLPRAAGAGGVHRDPGRSRWRSTPTRRARRGATAGCRDRETPLAPLPGLSPVPLMFGGAPIGGLYAPVSEETAAGTLAAAWAAGIRAFDTAPHYGVGALRAADRRVPGRAPAGRVHRRAPRSAGCWCPPPATSRATRGSTASRR